MKSIASAARRAALPVAALLLVAAASHAQTAVLFGALTNFDILNDTGQVTYGFEI